MRHGFWTTLSRIAITVMVALILQTGNNTGILSAQTQASENGQAPKKVTEPVFRVSKLNDTKSGKSSDVVSQPKAKSSQESPTLEGNRVADSSALLDPVPVATPSVSKTTAIATPVKAEITPAVRAPHPLDRAVSIAEKALVKMRSSIYDYTAIMAKREQVNGVIGSSTYLNVKVRCPRILSDGSQTPFSIYMKFLRPKEAAGREVIWVDGQNEGKLIAHEPPGGLIGTRTFYLDPTGFLAMRGQRYPIYEAGLENLIIKLIEKAERDRAAGNCEVNYREGAEINKRPCSVIELIHDDPNAGYEFHKAQVYLDDELNIPVRYVSYDWPETPGGEPKLIEEYTYYNVKINVGFTDIDFSPENVKYRYPKR